MVIIILSIAFYALGIYLMKITTAKDAQHRNAWMLISAVLSLIMGALFTLLWLLSLV